MHLAKPYQKKSKIKTVEVNSQLTEKGSKLNHEWGTKGPNKATLVALRDANSHYVGLQMEAQSQLRAVLSAGTQWDSGREGQAPLITLGGFKLHA